ncbi:acetolactate synthase large subunit [Ramlibacter sp. AN1015]|uniref:acetolactate synthase large subunit n=1 Tax=Ramlibacter sp. AN1015 TaxID=3133428 RepID=UPI0030BC3408
MNGADALCATLLAAGIDTCFANPGTSEMHFVAALDRQPRMRCVLGLFEGVVTGAADGYARMAERPAATLLHLGPGLANGLANLHNARRANTPMVNIVGDHATYHLQHDAPLTSDIEGLARPMSHWVRSVRSSDSVSADAAQAVVEARTHPGRIATLIVPADTTWNPATGPVVTAPAPVPRQRVDATELRRAADMIRSGKRTTLMLSGVALREKALLVAARIAQHTGVQLLAQQSNARMERGAGRPAIERVPFSTELAVSQLREVEQLVLVGAKAPVGFFAYPGQPSVLTPKDCAIHTLASPAHDLQHALEWLADELGVPTSLAPSTPELARPALPEGTLTAQAVMTALAALMPENSILCDESVSSGRTLFGFTHNAPRHDYLQITGGSIGIGIPLATGAAIACPQRKVICLQADGSAMYTAQGLWTQAREQLDVVTIIFSNRSYAILRNELKALGAGEPGRNARRMLELDQPPLDWVQLARGMGVEGTRATSAEAFREALRRALAEPGPHLIEAVL